MAERGLRKRLIGTVVSNKMDKSALVLVERLTKHQTYKKYLKRHAKYMAHDPENRCGIGDKVKIIETRPISRRKRWRVIEVVNQAKGADIES